MKFYLFCDIMCLLAGLLLLFGIYLSLADPIHNKVSWVAYVLAPSLILIGLRGISKYKKGKQEPITINDEPV